MIDFFSQYPLISYKAQEIIYRPDEMIDRVAFVKLGYIRLFNIDESGREITYSGLKAIFPLSYFYAHNQIPNQYYFQALTDISLWKAPISEFKSYLAKNPDTSLSFINISIGSLMGVLQSWETSLDGEAYSRVARLLLTLGRDYGKKQGTKVQIDFHTTHQLIASMLAISRETASIHIKKLEKQKFITQQKNTIIINDYQKMFEKF